MWIGTNKVGLDCLGYSELSQFSAKKWGLSTSSLSYWVLARSPDMWTFSQILHYVRMFIAHSLSKISFFSLIHSTAINSLGLQQASSTYVRTFLASFLLKHCDPSHRHLLSIRSPCLHSMIKLTAVLFTQTHWIFTPPLMVEPLIWNQWGPWIHFQRPAQFSFLVGFLLARKTEWLSIAIAMEITSWSLLQLLSSIL